MSMVPSLAPPETFDFEGGGADGGGCFGILKDDQPVIAHLPCVGARLAHEGDDAVGLAQEADHEIDEVAGIDK